ncbi:MAG: carboxypeptidase-like regulatory domain-containing protein [Solirubrobacterales bacterium]
MPHRPDSPLKLVRCTIVLAAIAMALLGWTTSSAQAGSYQVTQCHRGTGAGLDSWQWFGDGWWVHDECTNSVGVRGLGIAGRMAGWQTPTLPTGLTIDSVSFISESKNGAGVGTYGLTCVNTLIPCTGNGSIVSLDANPSSVTESKTVVAPGSKAFSLLQTSGGGTISSHAHILAHNFAFTMNDSVAPGVARTGGSLTADGSWNRGTRSVGFSVTDTQSGGASMLMTFDNALGHPLATTRNAACNYRRFMPCPTSFNDLASVNTTSLSDGSHTVHLFGYDAGGNVAIGGSGLTFSTKIDNTPPGLPGPLTIPVTGQNGWTNINDFDINWVASGESLETATQSGVAKVWFDIGPTQPGQADPPAVAVPVGGSAGSIAATRTTLSNISVPTKGAWTLDLWTEDAAGNASPKRDASLKFDPTVPDKAAGIANGWIGKAELLAGAEQRWIRPRNANEIPSMICGYSFSIDQLPFTDPGPIPTYFGDRTSLLLPPNISEGHNFAHFRAVTCSGTPAAAIEHTAVDVDLTDPTVTVDGVPKTGWTRVLPSLFISATDELSGMTPAPELDPDYRHGAFVEYAFGSEPFHAARGGTADVAIPSNAPDGHQTVRIRATDLSGNTASTPPVRFSLDRTGPSGYIRANDPRRPRLIRVEVADAHAGVMRGTIQVAPAIGGEFSDLATDFSAGELVSTFPELTLPSGEYRVRAVVHDGAGNSSIVDRGLNGEPVRILSPMRIPTRVQLRVLSSQLMCNGRVARTCKKQCARGRKCRRGTIRGRRQTLESDDAVVGFGNPASLSGSLTRGDGSPIPDARISFVAHRAGQPEHHLGATLSGSDGSFRFHFLAETSTTVRAEYAGTEIESTSNDSATVRVPARVGIRLSHRRIRTRRWLKFTGRVIAPAGVKTSGILVQFQFRNGNRWQAGPFLVRTDSTGAFKARYQFKSVGTHPIRVRFRVTVPTQADWPYATGASVPRSVIVLP